MKIMRPVLSTALLGLCLTLGGVGSAEPKGDKAPPGAAKKPGKDKPGPSGPGRGPEGRGPKDEGGPPGRGAKGDGPGRGPEGAPGRGEGGPPGKGPMGMPGRGPEGDGPMGVPFKRLRELEEKEKAGTLSDEEKAELERLRQGPGHMKHRQARKQRMAELEEKEKAGSLTDDEKAELDKARKIQGHFDELRQKHEEHKKDRSKRRRASKREAMKHFPGFRKHPKAHHEFQKHAKRLAHLERAREVAEASGKDDLVARIDKLVEKENARHEKWLEHHKGDNAPKNDTPKGDTPKDDAPEGAEK